MKLIYFLLFLFLIPSVSAVVGDYNDIDKILTIKQGKNTLFTVQLIEAKPDLVTMTEIFKITPYVNYTLNKNIDLTNTFNKIYGQNNIINSEWKLLNYYNISKEVQDWGNITRTRNITLTFWDNILNIFYDINTTEEYQSWEVVGTHIEYENKEVWEDLPYTIDIVENKYYYLKLTYYKKAEINFTSILTIPSFFGISAPQMTWWNNSWNYSTYNLIPNGSRPYQISLNISNSTGTNNATHVFCNGNCNIGFKDIRFTLDNTTLLPYWIDYKNYGKVWVNLTANGTVNMYYGNIDIIDSLSNNATTFDFFDDGNGTMDAYSVTGSPTKISGRIRIIGDNNWGTNGFLSTKTFNYPISLEWISYWDASAYPAYTMFGIGQDIGDPNLAGNRLLIFDWATVGMNSKNNLVSTNMGAYSLNTNYSNRISIKPNSGFKKYWGAGFYPDFRIDNTTWIQNGGNKIELTTYQNLGYTYIDDIIVRRYTTTEPIWDTWSSEYIRSDEIISPVIEFIEVWIT